jgi:hypothetical protein
MANARGDAMQTPLGDPKQIEPYWIIGTLGSGGMGQVRLVREIEGDAIFRERFARAVKGVFTAAVVLSCRAVRS